MSSERAVCVCVCVLAVLTVWRVCRKQCAAAALPRSHLHSLTVRLAAIHHLIRVMGRREAVRAAAHLNPITAVKYGIGQLHGLSSACGC